MDTGQAHGNSQLRHRFSGKQKLKPFLSEGKIYPKFESNQPLE